MDWKRPLALLLALWLPLSGGASAAPIVAPPVASGAGAAGAFQPAAAAAALETFFGSPTPDIGLARGVSAALRALDTAEPATLRQLEPLVLRLRAAARSLASPEVDRKATEAGLAAAALKLQALNYPELRHLLAPEQQRAVGGAFWAYQTHLTVDVRRHDWVPSSLTLEQKIDGISRALRASRVAPSLGNDSPLASDAVVRVEAVGGDISKKKANALLSSVQPSGLCEGGINAMIECVGGPGFGAQVEAAKPLVDGRAWVARGDASNAGLFENVVFVTDAMRSPLRELVLGGLRAADEAGFASVSIPALRTGWNFGFLETSYEEIVAETLRGVRLFEEQGRRSVESISLVIHDNPRLLGLFQAAVSRPSDIGAGAESRGAVERIASRLAERPINDARYGSEKAFLAEFTRAARELFPPGDVSPETRLLLALEPRARGGRFAKNMAILADDLYLSIGVPGSFADRYELGRLRARFGAASVAPVDPAAERREAPTQRAVKGGWLPGLVPGGLGRALGAALDFISARDLSILGFPSVAERWARSKELRARLEAFHDRLVTLREDFPSRSEVSIWELALDVNGGDARDAADMLGGIVGQTKRPLRYVERRLIGRVPEAEGAEPAFIKAARSYYLLGELHELGLRRFGRSPLYPEGSGARGPKFWHFYGAAMVAARLGRQSAWAARLAGVGIALAYEAATFPTNVGLFGARGLARGIFAAVADSRRDVAQHARGHVFGRGLAAGRSLAEEPVLAPSKARLAWLRARVQALDAFWKFWWEAGPPVIEQWSRYAARLTKAAASGRRAAARDPRGLFIRLRVLGLAVGLADLPSLVASDVAVKAEASALFERHIDAGPGARLAFDRLIDRAAARYAGRSRNKLRSIAAYALRESSTLSPDQLAGYYDRLASGTEVEPDPKTREAALADFKRMAESAILSANAEAMPGGRILGFVIVGSYAHGAVRVGSDLDLQIVTEDGRPARDAACPKGLSGPCGPGWLERLEAEWRKARGDIELEVYSNTYLPPDRRLLQGLLPEPYLIVSPYDEAHELLGDRRPAVAREAGVRREPRPSRWLTLAARGIVRAWMRLMLAASTDDVAIDRDRSLRADMRDVTLSGRGSPMFPRPAGAPRQNSPIYRSMLEPWSLAHLLESHAPVRVGAIVDKRTFSRRTVSVLNIPIKMPGTGFRIPAELEQFREFLQKMIDHEAAVNPRLDEFYAYLTVDQSRVKRGATHRKPGIHVDGVQGARYPVKLPPEHTYSASDMLGTVFYDQAFDLTALDPARHHVHAELERQADEANARAAEDYGMFFWDSYSVHRADVAREDGLRTFVRVEFSLKVYDSVGDTRSPLFDYAWSRVARPIPAGLDDRPVPR